MEFDGFTSKVCHRATLRRWRQALRKAATISEPQRSYLLAQAQELRAALDLFERSIARNKVDAEPLLKPSRHVDWAWRPAVWEDTLQPAGLVAPETGTTFAPGIKIFHDCPLNEIILRQTTNPVGDIGTRRHALMLDVLGFEGSFMSLVIDLPKGALDGLTDRHIISVCTSVRADRPVGIFARLNIRYGPNTEQIVRELPREMIVSGGDMLVEFDLAYVPPHKKQVDHMWLDLIFEEPAMCRVVFGDMLLSRHPRAEV